MELECIFDPYFEKIIACDKDYECEGCEVRDIVRSLIASILFKKEELKS